MNSQSEICKLADDYIALNHKAEYLCDMVVYYGDQLMTVNAKNALLEQQVNQLQTKLLKRRLS